MTTILNRYKDFISLLSPIYGEGEARSMGRIVFEDAFKIFDFSEQTFPEVHLDRLLEIQKRLLNQEPIQYILGQADFYGLKFKVDNRVLIPRPETEELVHWIIQHVKQSKRKVSILDIGTGSGCIPITLKRNLPDCKVSACDISKDALAVAKENAQFNEVDIDFYRINILDQKEWINLPEFDIIVSNPPYIPFEEKVLMPKNVLEYEPELALFVENNEPLIFYQTIVELAMQKCKTNGLLYFEMNEYNANDVRDLMTNQGFDSVEIQKDLQDKNRMIRGYKN